MDDLLSSMGFTGYERAVIKTLSSVESSGATAIVKRSRVPQGRIYGILEVLRQKGVIEVIPTSPKRYRIDDLRAALVRHVRQREEALASSMSAIRSLRTPSRDIAPDTKSHSVRMMTGREEHIAATSGLADAAKDDLSQVAPLFVGSFASRSSLLAAAERGVRVRVIVGTVTDKNRARIDECLRCGISVRVLREPQLLSMVLRDREEFLLGVQDHRKDEERLTLRGQNPGILKMLSDTFERDWKRSREIRTVRALRT